MTPTSLRWKCACLAAASPSLLMLCLAALLSAATDVDTRHLSSVAEKEAGEHVAAELQTRAQNLALDAADAVALSAPLGQPTLEERLESFLTRDSSLSRLSVEGRDEASLFESQRPGPRPSEEVTGEATRRVRDLDAQMRVQVGQPTPPLDLQLMGQLFGAAGGTSPLGPRVRPEQDTAARLA